MEMTLVCTVDLMRGYLPDVAVAALEGRNHDRRFKRKR